MDDLLLLTPDKRSQRNKLEDLLKEWLNNRSKILPKKCQLLKKELQYMGNTIFIKGKKVYVKPMRRRIKAVQRLRPCTMSKGCRSFARAVSLFCPE